MQAHPYFIDKIIQFYECHLVRHGGSRVTFPFGLGKKSHEITMAHVKDLFFELHTVKGVKTKCSFCWIYQWLRKLYSSNVLQESLIRWGALPCNSCTRCFSEKLDTFGHLHVGVVQCISDWSGSANPLDISWKLGVPSWSFLLLTSRNVLEADFCLSWWFSVCLERLEKSFCWSGGSHMADPMMSWWR